MPTWTQLCAERPETHWDSAEYFARGVEWALAAGWPTLALLCGSAMAAHRAIPDP